MALSCVTGPALTIVHIAQMPLSIMHFRIQTPSRSFQLGQTIVIPPIQTLSSRSCRRRQTIATLKIHSSSPAVTVGCHLPIWTTDYHLYWPSEVDRVELFSCLDPQTHKVPT